MLPEERFWSAAPEGVCSPPNLSPHLHRASVIKPPGEASEGSSGVGKVPPVPCPRGLSCMGDLDGPLALGDSAI